MDLDLLGAANAVLDRWRALVSWIFAGAAVAVLVTVAWSGDHVASSRFIAQGQSSFLSGLASQFNLSLGTVDRAQSPEFYVELLQSREILRAGAGTEYVFLPDLMAEDSLRGTLVELYQVDGSTPETRLRAAAARLASDVTATADPRTGLVLVQTRAPWPGLAESINARLLELLNEFNVERRRSQAAAQRAFTESRLAEAREEHRSTEDELAQFLQANRQFQNSPMLTFEMNRLQRQVDLRQQLYTSLALEHERARIEEVRNTPVLTVVEGPQGSAKGTRGSPVMLLAIGLFAGTVVGLIHVYVAAQLCRQRERHPGSYDRLRSRLGRLGMRRGAIAEGS